MSAEALLRDPGFQLNLLLWMTRAQPANAYLVRPLFQELGFDLLYIENPFPLPEETARAASATGLDISVKSEPDVFLRRNNDKKALYIETKAAAFSVASSSARQARGHLLATGPAFAEVMKPLKECLLCYVLPHPDEPQMDACLTNLRDELSHSGLKPGPHSVNGLSMNGSDVVYAWDGAFRDCTGIAGDSAVDGCGCGRMFDGGEVLRDSTHSPATALTSAGCPEQATLHPVRPAPTLFSCHREPPAHFDGPRNITARKAAMNAANVNCQGVPLSFPEVDN